MPCAILMTIVVAVLVFLIVRGAVEHGSLVLRTDPTREAIFVTTALTPPASGFSVSSGHILEGHILGAEIDLQARRDGRASRRPRCRLVRARRACACRPVDRARALSVAAGAWLKVER